MKVKALDITRRSFVKLAAVVGAAAAAAGVQAPTALAEESAAASAADVKRVRTACRGCGKYECGVIVTVENGRVAKI